MTTERTREPAPTLSAAIPATVPDAGTGPAVTLPATGTAALRRATRSAASAAVREAALLLGLYAAYSMVRLLADDARGPAFERAAWLLRVERAVALDVEAGFNHLVAGSQWLSLAMSFWYASAHFVVTAGVLVAVYLRHPGRYARLRSTLVLATAGALVMYLTLPTAPPRLMGAPYLDVLARTSTHGWWGAQSAVPQGWAGQTNELAALPSMHAGWSLWVAIVVLAVPCARRWKVAGVGYAAVTALVIVGTANHWILDVVAGWAVVALAAAACLAGAAGRRAGASDQDVASASVGDSLAARTEG